MTTRDVAVFSRRRPIKAGLRLLLGYRLGEESDWIWSFADAFAGGSETPRLLVIDVLKLFAAEVTYIPRWTSASPDVLVVGAREDARELIAPWNEGIAALPMTALNTEMLRRMLAGPEDGCEFYDYPGRHGAEKVHTFLLRLRREREPSRPP